MSLFIVFVIQPFRCMAAKNQLCGFQCFTDRQSNVQLSAKLCWIIMCSNNYALWTAALLLCFGMCPASAIALTSYCSKEPHSIGTGLCGASRRGNYYSGHVSWSIKMLSPCMIQNMILSFFHYAWNILSVCPNGAFEPLDSLRAISCRKAISHVT